MKKRELLAVTLGITVILPLQAADDTFVPSVQATYRESDVRIDGRIEEPAWLKGQPATEFVQGQPVEGAPAEEPTEVWVLYDDQALYLGVIMHDQTPDLIGDQLVRRDELGPYDYFEFSIDPNNDHRTGYRFRVSAAGVQRDSYLFDDVREDVAWDAVWESAVHRDSTGWSAELRIPLSQLRYDANEDVQSWGVNFSRWRLVSNELTYFALESRVRHGTVSVFGKLNGLQFQQSVRRIEVRPYGLTNARTAPATPGDPFFSGQENGSQFGLDLRYGLGAAFTLDATINPDFGQVEVDPAVINLTAFETFYPEKRPFFVEDAQVFDFSLSRWSNRLFYSRRIGRAPQRRSPPFESSFQKTPTETTILGAAKLTGRTSRGLSVGLLSAITGEETGMAIDSSSGRKQQFMAEPQSQYSVLRVRQDLRDGASEIGAIATAMHRNLPGDGSFDFLTSSAFTGGINFEHNWGGPRSRNWALWGYLTSSLIQGPSSGILGVQESNNHYFQRPDATRFSLDSSATSMTGVDWRLQFERRSAEHWTGGVWLSEVTPGYEINDLGFSRSSERLDMGARIGYQEITPGRLFQSYRLSLFMFNNWRHEALDNVFSLSSWKHAHKRGALFARAGFVLLNYWGFGLTSRFSPETLSDIATRGGPLMTSPGSLSFGVQGNTDYRKRIVLGTSIDYEKDQKGGYEWRSAFRIAIRPSPSWEILILPNYRQQLNPAQYVATTDDLGYEPTFGRRYLFSDVEQRTVSMETRINVAFNPTLTFQFFAQPLIATGDYITHKQLKQPESFDFIEFSGDASCFCGTTYLSQDGQHRHFDFNLDGISDYSIEVSNFNIRSFRMNAVLRWEYRPGSTLFLVWQQTRYSDEILGKFDFKRNMREFWEADTENMFILKLNYWFGA